jgi:excinuclease ABC subunit C
VKKNTPSNDDSPNQESPKSEKSQRKAGNPPQRDQLPVIFTLEELKEIRAGLLLQAREAAQSPGVYLMKDDQGAILYVGKAKNLKNRVTTYFQAPPHDVGRIELLVSRIRRFDMILTETESEALILECTLIKKHKPKFNVRLKDDKAYPYLKISLSQEFPRIEWTRRVKRDGGRYFGPFPSAASARMVLRMLNETFQLRDCSDNTFRFRSRPCILFQMEKCTAPCVGKISREAYQETLSEVVRVLEGKGDQVIASLRRGMEDSAAREEFEVAAHYRDQLQALELVTATQVAADPDSSRAVDVAVVARAEAEAHGVLLQIRDGKILAVRHYHLQNVDSQMPNHEIVSGFLSQYYLAADRAAELESAGESSDTSAEIAAFGNLGPVLAHPDEVLVLDPPEDVEALEKGLQIKIRVPETDADRQLIGVATMNARYGLEASLKKARGHGMEALEEVMERLHLSRLPSRIECYDISNTQGEESVASRVTFIDGAPDKNLYRRYKIKTVEGANDFASMREVLGRRFSKRDEDLPDLLVVDGGKGQLSQATAILDELGVQGVGIVGLAKARTESDFQSAEVKSTHERVFIPGRKNPVPLLPHTAAYKLLVHIRDEAHRFAITYHRNLRSKRSLQSED